MTGGQCVGAEIARRGQEIGEFDRLVAGHAWDRGFAGDIAGSKRIDHRFAKSLFIIKNIMRNSECFRDPPGIINVLSGAARSGPVHGGAMIIELQRHAKDIIALALEKAGHHG